MNTTHDNLYRKYFVKTLLSSWLICFDYDGYDFFYNHADIIEYQWHYDYADLICILGNNFINIITVDITSYCIRGGTMEKNKFNNDSIKRYLSIHTNASPDKIDIFTSVCVSAVKHRVDGTLRLYIQGMGCSD